MAQVTDPVCGMTIDADQAAAHTEYRGDTVYFCSEACANRFSQAPERYAGAARGSDTASEEMRRRTPPRETEGGITTPMFGSAGSGGAEFEPIPQEDEIVKEEKEEE